MLKHLVTVTCFRDLNQMILQAYSVNLFIDRHITHHVFIEDLELSLEDWEVTLRPLYKTHTLKLYYNTLQSKTDNGWIRQQAIKLLAVNYVQDDYLILDSKNFYIKKSEFNYMIPDGSWHLIDSDFFDSFVSFFAEYSKIPMPKYYFAQHTPFKIRKEIADKILQKFDVLSILEKSMSKEIYPSEFVIYSFMTDTYLEKDDWHERYHNNTIYHTFWWNKDVDVLKFEEIYNSNVEIIGIHKNVWFQKNNKIQLLSEWICSKGLSKEYVFPATINMDWKNTFLQDL